MLKWVAQNPWFAVTTKAGQEFAVPPETVEILWTMPQGRHAEMAQPSYEMC